PRQPAHPGDRGPSGAETTRLPAAPVNGQGTDGSGSTNGTGGTDGSGSTDSQGWSGRNEGPSEAPTRAWSAVGDGGDDDASGDSTRGTVDRGSHRREDKDPDWRAPWERED
ncbi:hypothetical protein G6012_09375, partial [Dietzia schimae]|nr:hypothetical protein [Dietzia kunjamensis subsp. schimae]